MSALEETLGSGVEVPDETEEKSGKPKHLLGRLRDRVEHEVKQNKKSVDPKAAFVGHKGKRDGKGAHKKPAPKKRSPIKGQSRRRKARLCRTIPSVGWASAWPAGTRRWWVC